MERCRTTALGSPPAVESAPRRERGVVADGGLIVRPRKMCLWSPRGAEAAGRGAGLCRRPPRPASLGASQSRATRLPAPGHPGDQRRPREPTVSRGGQQAEASYRLSRHCPPACGRVWHMPVLPAAGWGVLPGSVPGAPGFQRRWAFTGLWEAGGPETAAGPESVATTELPAQQPAEGQENGARRGAGEQWERCPEVGSRSRPGLSAWEPGTLESRAPSRGLQVPCITGVVSWWGRRDWGEQENRGSCPFVHAPFLVGGVGTRGGLCLEIAAFSRGRGLSALTHPPFCCVPFPPRAWFPLVVSLRFLPAQDAWLLQARGLTGSSGHGSLHADASSFLAMRAAGRCARAPAVRPLGGFALLRWFSCPASQASEEAQFSTCFATHVPRTLGSEGRKHTASTHSPVPLYDYRPGQAGLFGSSQTTCRDADLLPPPRRT